MADESFKPKPDTSKSARKKSIERRKQQIEQAKERLSKGTRGANANPIVTDETYGELRENDRVVMRHQIALNLDSFRAATEEFDPRPTRTYPELESVRAPFFSVIIPNYNGLTFLPPLLEGLQKQTFQDFEAILVDDAGTDRSVAWVEEHHPWVRILANRTNVGFAASCNVGADAAYGRVIVLVNNDTEPEPEWLAELAKAICAHPDAGIFASKLLLYGERTTIHSAGDVLGADGIPRNRGVWARDDGRYDRAGTVFSACGGAAAYRREVWRALGGFDEDFWMYLEDADLGFRAQLMGVETVYVPTARVYHHLSASGGGLASYYVGRNTIWNIAKNMPRGLLVRNLHRIVFAQLRIAADAALHWRGQAARDRLAGQVAGIAGLPRQLQKRRLIQRRRLISDRDLAAKLTDED